MMLTTAVEWGLLLLAVYLVVGAVFSVFLHLRGLRQIDPGTAGAGWFFRLIVTPGLVALWPLMLRRFAHARRNKGNGGAPADAAALRRRHRRLSTGLGIFVPVLALAGLIARPSAPQPEPAAREIVPEPPPLAELLLRDEAPFGELPIAIAIRASGEALQLELDIARDLELPGLLAFWAPATDSARASFLGAVWGPGTRRYPLPVDAAAGGSVTLLSTGHRERIASWSHPPLAGR
ncbi:MAG: hypothetical protein JSV80_00430 [Acidobacteriota bacterium]|nr:MAG: hypothetical protein JSV80_00430 [Acidobacteriota bacterium]